MQMPRPLCRPAVRAFVAPLALVLLLAPAAYSQRPSQQSAGPGGVQIRVRSSDEKDAISGADVTVLAAGRGETVVSGFTDGSGRIMFDSLPRGAYEIVVRKDGYETAHENVLIVSTGRENFFIQMSRSSEAGAGPASTVSARKAVVPEPARKAYEEGVASLKDDPAKSAEHFRRAIKEFPDYADAYMMLGYAQYRSGAKKEAVEALSKAVELDPKLARAHLLLGQIYLDDKKAAEAEKPLRESVSLDPQSSEAHLRLAHCLYSLNKLDEALRHARRAVELPNASPLAHLLLADIYVNRKENKEALRELEKFEKADPQSTLMPRVRQMIERLRAEGGGR
jgi:Tfp pilus assembly protein PilF